MKMSPLDESVESNPDLLGAEVGQSVFPNVKRVDSSLSLLVFCSPYYIIHYFFLQYFYYSSLFLIHCYFALFCPHLLVVLFDEVNIGAPNAGAMILRN